jgi:hypothetical protein
MSDRRDLENLLHESAMKRKILGGMKLNDLGHEQGLSTRPVGSAKSPI